MFEIIPFETTAAIIGILAKLLQITFGMMLLSIWPPVSCCLYLCNYSVSGNLLGDYVGDYVMYYVRGSYDPLGVAISGVLFKD